ncbi:hypothetical protein [Aliarcobacter butzleri]|uniref:hypothetical protein n=1 Tax=Aliarcobacter butzleri TaxID=28197 RepID=UPI0002295B06|nr:hypothetical protein [Aliarcobacter butzleri]BAK70267.1 conserved hypothetical protein [Aliarcobacter butzleri ED-1]
MNKANTFYEIQDAVAFNNPIDEKNEFYTDFSGFRKGFNERKIFKYLNINPTTKECNKISQTLKLFLSGHRGTGKTTELLKLKNEIDETTCFFTVFCDLSDEELDVNNIDFIDIIILILEKLTKTLDDKKIDIPKANIEPFYDWYEQRITEINNQTDESASIEVEGKAGIDLFSLFSLVTKTKGKLSGSNRTKETIRKVFKNKFSDFSLKFNEFILDIKGYLLKNGISKDLLFIIDGFEKIGSLEDRKKILIDNSNKFVEIKANMIITLPIELFSEVSRLKEFASHISFPLITLDENSKERFKEFIYKRIEKNLFDSEDTVEQIIAYGAGSPRETLKIISNAYIQAEGEIIDLKSVQDAQKSISEELMKYLDEKEISLLKQVYTKTKIPFSDELAKLLIKKVLLDYEDGLEREINPILLDNQDFINLIKA